MDTDGIWTAEFSTNASSGTGVVVLDKDSIRGGDSSYFYVGTLYRTGAKLAGWLTINHYSGPPESVFGSHRKLRLKLEGAVSNDLILAQGKPENNPFFTVSVRLRRVG